MNVRAFGPTGRSFCVVGQGTWNIPTRGAQVEEAREALRTGIDLGLVHVDSAEMYGAGQAEEIVREAVAGIRRESLFIVTKVLPQNATYRGTIEACEASLRRLGTDYLDVYLLHWLGSHPLRETMRALERLVDDGKIRALGVSNFDVDDLERAASFLERHPIACNQVLYHLLERGVERRLIPYCRERNIAVVGYSPFGSGDFPSSRSPGGRVLADVAQRYGASERAVALAFLTRLDGTFTIPKAAHVEHVRDNARGAEITLDAEATERIGSAFPLPPHGPLAML